MGKIGNTRTKSILWPSYDAAVAHGQQYQYAPYFLVSEIPPGYRFWGEVVTLLGRPDDVRGYKYRATSYFIDSRHSEKQLLDIRDGRAVDIKPFRRHRPLAWIDFEPHSTPVAGAGTIRRRYNPETTWVFEHRSSHGDPSVPDQFSAAKTKERRLTANDIARYRVAWRNAQRHVRAIRKAERKQELADRDEVAYRENLAILGGDDRRPVITTEAARKRFRAAESLVEHASHPDDLSLAMDMVVRNQGLVDDADEVLGNTEDDPEFTGEFLRKTAIKQIELMDFYIEALRARETELPDSPAAEWEADLRELRRLHDGYHSITQKPYPAAEVAIAEFTPKAEQPRRQSMVNPRGLPLSRADAGIGSGERGLAEGRPDGRPWHRAPHI